LGGNYQFAKIGIADGKPATDHIITATSKLKQMKADLTRQINVEKLTNTILTEIVVRARSFNE